MIDGLLEPFTLEHAKKALDWEGSNKALARMLSAKGYVASLSWDPATIGKRLRLWRREPTAQPLACLCPCHTGTCGASDMLLAERAIRLIEKLRPISADMVERIEALVDRAGVDHAKDALRLPADEVPF